MAFSVSMKHGQLFLAVVLLCMSVFCCNIGKAYDEEVPQTGTGLAGYDPFTGSGVVGHVPQTGIGVLEDEPAGILDKALLCFNEKHIYSSCEEAYRLTETGDIKVPYAYVEQYCHGPCLSETHLVLNCVENVMKHFVFYNKATIEAIRETIKAGCSYGPERGDFNVAEHLQAEENRADKTQIKILSGLGLAIIGHTILF
ncbi:uncharacterized protein LOC110612305 [Manihot esculenta]|uniref:DUF7731 domain-containing protein n=1 Tax=Manihot esculenta TaxID=3983 RepID=A0A2C9WAU9_MANES|nr:uncharacterized protein LOC110612305 [Manihot esculenta]